MMIIIKNSKIFEIILLRLFFKLIKFDLEYCIRMSINTEEVLKYINLAREYPKYYVALLDEQINSFTNHLNIKIAEDTLYQTVEGRTVWEEARQFLMNQQPIRPLDSHQGLMKASSDHASDIVKNNSTGHQGSDGSTFMDRIQRYSKKGKGSMIELLGTTHIVPNKSSIEQALINLIVDDGVPNRGHRKALYCKDYKYIGVDFRINEDKIYSVITMSQSNLQIIKAEPQNIATSTSHLQTMTQICSQIKDSSIISRKSKQNCIDQHILKQEDRKISIKPEQKRISIKNEEKRISIKHQDKRMSIRHEETNIPEKNEERRISEKRTSKVQNIVNKQTNADVVWTLKNVSNEQKPPSKTNVCSGISVQQHTAQQHGVQPSIMHSVEATPQSKKSITSSESSNVHPSNQYNVPIVKQNEESLKKQQNYQYQGKENSLKSSQHSLKSDYKDKREPHNLGYGISSEVQRFKIKSTLNSPFLKSAVSSNGFGSTVGGKKVVQKKETMRSWYQDEYLIKQVTTIVKYEDGTIQDFVEKHSILKNGSVLKQVTL